ncbi:MAG: cystathionine beta-lyase [Candidatus Dactylopiibacterium carminicum]|nr:MAG: cystathionine beta-lyase [Candidatus Dactylopiibacterium carminicum]
MKRPQSPNTRLLRAGRPHKGWVNTPVTRASSYIFENVEHWRDTRNRRDAERMLSYAARGTDSTYALEDALVELEGGYRAKVFPTGQAAIATILLGYLGQGDHVLITDAVYAPVRRFCSRQLSRMGVEHDYYRADGCDLAGRIKPNTRLIYVESPGSLAYEMVDLPAIVRLARAHGCLVAVDNTWGSGLLYRPLALGADISVMAATKYLGGHSDVMLGTVVTNQAAWQPMEEAAVDLGQTVGADDAWLTLRGMRSLAVRLAAHGQNALTVARWLQSRPEVACVHCPALPDSPSHALWLRDCSGTNGLLTVEFAPMFDAAAAIRFINALQLFGVGASWGGYESLALPVDMPGARTETDWSGRGGMARLHIGLESPEDLIADIEAALQALRG